MRAVLLATAGIIGLALPCSPVVRAGQVADLGADWSDSSNPDVGTFGSWTYRQGTFLLSHVSDWTPLGSSTPQPAWAPGTSNGDYLPAEFKATSNVSGSDQNGVTDWQAGDVIVHTTDPGNGAGNGPANFLWTSPINGTITISGDVFQARETTGRDNNWTLIVDGTVVSSGTMIGGDGYDRSNPFLFADGSGGASALTQTVQVGSTVELLIAKTASSTSGNFVGVDLDIVGASAVPEPSSWAMMGAGMVTLLGYARRRGARMLP